jgi:hypothetical protein
MGHQTPGSQPAGLGNLATVEARMRRWLGQFLELADGSTFP